MKPRKALDRAQPFPWEILWAPEARTEAQGISRRGRHCRDASQSSFAQKHPKTLISARGEESFWNVVLSSLFFVYVFGVERILLINCPVTDSSKRKILENINRWILGCFWLAISLKKLKAVPSIYTKENREKRACCTLMKRGLVLGPLHLILVLLDLQAFGHGHQNRYSMIHHKSLSFSEV